MTKQWIHASDLLNALHCPHKALKAYTTPKAATVLAPDKSEYYRQLDLLLEPLNLECGLPGDSLERTLDILADHTCGKDLRFQVGKLRTTIPLLFQKENGNWKAVYPVCSVAPKESLLWMLLINLLIARRCGVEIEEHAFLYLNKNAIRQEDSVPADFFLLSDCLRKAHGGFHSQSADEMLKELLPLVDEDALFARGEELFEHEASDFIPRRVKACTSPSKCPYYGECWKEDELGDDSSAFLTNCSNRQVLEQDGIQLLSQLDGNHIEGTPMQYAQIMAARNGQGLFIDSKAMQEWLDQIIYPISYLDFEWDTYALPPFVGMKPFDVLCFQYSLHIEQEDGRLEQSVYFSTGDCRKEFIEHLLQNIPPTGSIMVFNMEGAEKLRLMQLANQFEEYRPQLEALCARMVDLSLPFEQGSWYDLRQRGKSSLKTLLPLFAKEDGYALLDIHNGMEAVLAFRQATKSDDSNFQHKIAQQICDYCSMDTYAERELFLGLKNRLASWNANQEAKLTLKPVEKPSQNTPQVEEEKATVKT